MIQFDEDIFTMTEKNVDGAITLDAPQWERCKRAKTL